MMDYLQRIERQLDLPPAEKEEVMRELRSHYQELKAELISSGMSEAEAVDEAGKRMGEPRPLVGRIGAAHGTASWKSTLLAIIPFPLAYLLPWCAATTKMMWPSEQVQLLPLAVFAVILAVGAIRELVLGRRPVWLATWLAVLLMVLELLALRGWLIEGVTTDPVRALGYRITVLLIAATAGVWAIWGLPEWRIPALLALATRVGFPIAFAKLLGQGTLVAGVPMHMYALAMTTSTVIIWMAFARRMFGTHERSVPLHASLFLASLFVGQWLPPLGNDAAGSLSGLTFGFSVILVLALAVVLYIHAKLWWAKLLALTLGFTTVWGILAVRGTSSVGELLLASLWSFAVPLACILLVAKLSTQGVAEQHPQVVE